MSMSIDGNKIAEDLKQEISAKILMLAEVPTLTIFYDEEDPVGVAYVKRKEAFGGAVGVKVKKEAFLPEEPQEQVIDRIKQAGLSSDGVIIQLPTPERYDCEALLNAINPDADVDLISPENIKRFESGLTRLIPPVVGAMKIIVDAHNVAVEGEHAVVVGEGRLVGKPAATWLRKKGARVVTVTKESGDIQQVIREANIIVLGAGAPGLLTADMLKEGVTIFDAGATVREGKVQGDAHPGCADKAFVFTPVPGGIGPMAVACAFQNLLMLAEETKRRDVRRE